MPEPWLIDLPQCDSTSTWALHHLDALAHGACIHTTQQTAGRGQPGSTWHSPPGVLTASLVVDVGEVTAPFALLAGLAVAHTVEDLLPGLRVQLKWPNDCLIAGRKLAGILCEQPTVGRLVVGIGLNIDPQWNLCPEALSLASTTRWAPTSLAEHGRSPSTVAVLTLLRRYLLEAAGLVIAGGWRRLLPDIRARDALRDQPLRLETAQGTLRGNGAGIDDEGRLLVRIDDTITPIASARHVTIDRE